MNVQVLCGDALEVLRTLPDASVNACVTSPPYGTIINYAADRPRHANLRVRGDFAGSGAVPSDLYADWLLPIIAEIARTLVSGGVLALNVGGQAHATYPEEVAVRIPRETPLVLHERVCWVKANAIPTGSRGAHLIPEWEPVWVWRNGDALAYFGRDDIRRPYAASTLRRARNGTLHRGNTGHHAGQIHPYVRGEKPEAVNPAGRDAPNVIWAAPEQSPDWPHPARFPEALPEFFVAAYCPPAATVLDPSCGSGTTLAVADRLGRNALGIDLSPDYCAMARRRIAREQAQTRLPLHELAGGDAR